MRKIFLLLFVPILFSCKNEKLETDPKVEKTEITSVIDAWHQAASKANFDTYFSLMTKDAVFIGTDASENWQLYAFKAYSKPHFDKGKAWTFKSVQRNIYLSDDGNFAWFDELLDTQMKICRGSGVLKKENGKWKIAHYVLSMTVPNDLSNPVIDIKKEWDDEYLKSMRY